MRSVLTSGVLALLLTLSSTASAGDTLDAAEAALKQEATQAWAALEAQGDAASETEVKAFLDRYQGVEVSGEGNNGLTTRAVSVPEIYEAAAWLEARDDTGGRTGVSSADLSELLINSRGVRSCWALYKQETGAAPTGRILVDIVIQPDGRPSKASINGGQYAGTSLDRCLNTAIRRTQFPPFEGLEVTVEYPFVL